MTSPTTRQGNLPFPKLDTPFVNTDGYIAIPWYRFLIGLFQKTGQSSSVNTSIVLQQDTVTGQINVVNSSTGAILGQLQFSSASGGPAVPVAVTSNPFVYVAPASGFILTSSGQVEISRDKGVTYYQASLTGESLPVVMNDRVRITYFGANAPTLTFFPNA